MLKKVLIVVGCLVVVFVAANVVVAYENKHNFETVMAEYAH